jgi:hypothetical protein
MPRKSENKRIEILFSPEQYAVLIEYVQAEVKGSMSATVRSNEIGETIRDILAAWIPSFADADPLVRRGKYKRK